MSVKESIKNIRMKKSAGGCSLNFPLYMMQCYTDALK